MDFLRLDERHGFIGRVTDVIDHGTIITVVLRRGLRIRHVHFDYAPFRQMVEACGQIVKGVRCRLIVLPTGDETLRREDIDA